MQRFDFSDQTVMSADDCRLPPSDTKSWVASRKADVVRAIRDGILTRIDACLRYRLSDEELRLWERAIDAAGTPGLRVTRVPTCREVFEGCH
jgi:hypothetical protein